MERIICTEEYLERLLRIPLFSELAHNVKSTLPQRLDCQFYYVGRHEVIARQGTACRQLYVLLKGSIRAEIIDDSGNEVILEYIDAPRSFATMYLFFASEDNLLPLSFFAAEDCILFTATKESVFRLISEDPDILRSFLNITARCSRSTLSRLNVLSHKNVRNRFVAYLFEHRPSGSALIRIAHNQVQLAKYLNVTRPALSKEINRMVKEGLIRVDGKTIELMNGQHPGNYLK